jgi:hypothetical protein
LEGQIESHCRQVRQDHKSGPLKASGWEFRIDLIKIWRGENVLE